MTLRHITIHLEISKQAYFVLFFCVCFIKTVCELLVSKDSLQCPLLETIADACYKLDIDHPLSSISSIYVVMAILFILFFFCCKRNGKERDV